MHVFGIVFLFLAAILPLSLWPVTVFGIQTSAAAIAVIPVLVVVPARLRARRRDPCRGRRVALDGRGDRCAHDDGRLVVARK